MPRQPSVPPRPDWTRRRVLSRALSVIGLVAVGGAVVSSATACELLAEEPTRTGHALDTLLAGAAKLADTYDATVGAVPALADQLTPIRDAHRAHVTALAEAIGSTAPGPSAAAAVGASRSEAIAGLLKAERAAVDEARAACLSTTARLAPLIGSIAAARASHVEVMK